MTRAGSKTEQLIDALRKLGTARGQQLADATGIAASSIQGMLDGAVKKGEIIVCKVSVPGGHQAQREYRIGPGIANTFQPLNLKRTDIAFHAPDPKQPQPAPGLAAHDPIPASPRIDTDSARAGSSPPTPLTKAHAVAEATPKPAAERRGMGPEQPKASAGDAIQCGIDDDGTLLLTTSEGFLELSPKQARKLGHFMGATHGIWNPF
jgi:hypothetical protein